MESDPRTDPDEYRPELPTVSVACTSPDKHVFTEKGNTEGWIATDTTVDLER